ncbi:lanthionine synthetase LanC family protein [Larkinella bovis]|uniref:Lanthionine synthetase LanC family protein n=1 Tax=Larkinella bovis TaxID=683041 RepID=A0ABW0IAH0_9BACT
MDRVNVGLSATHIRLETELHRLYANVAAQPVTGLCGLFSGQIGYALFECYYQRQFGLTDNCRIWDRLEVSIDAIATGSVDHAFAGGMAGIAWGYLHLSNHGFLADSADDPQDVVAALDEPLFLLSMDDLRAGQFDYLHGGLGVCLYFLERPRSATIESYLTQLVAQLETLSIRQDDGSITWRFHGFDAGAASQPVTYNPSLSHGTASIVAVLCLLHRHGYAQRSCARLIDGGLRWLWNVRNKNHPAVFPKLLVEGQPRDEFCRMAWCYGDPGIAHTFRLAGETLGNPRWTQIADYTMRKAASRRSRPESLVSDLGFCHGSAGLAHLFSKFARWYPHPVFAETARFWSEVTLTHSLPAVADDGSPKTALLSHRGSFDLLEGEASTGLVLLAQLGADTAWERAFLLQ